MGVADSLRLADVPTVRGAIVSYSGFRAKLRRASVSKNWAMFWGG